MSNDRPDQLEADLSAYLDGELSPERARAVEQLLRESPAARRTLEELRDVADQLAELPRCRAPDELAAAMMRQAERRMLFGEGRPRRGPRVLRLVLQVSASAAVMAACALVGWYVLRSPAPPIGQPPLAVEEMSDGDAVLARGRGGGVGGAVDLVDAGGASGADKALAKAAPREAVPSMEMESPPAEPMLAATSLEDDALPEMSEQEAFSADDVVVFSMSTESPEDADGVFDTFTEPPTDAETPADVVVAGVPIEPAVRVAITPASELEYAATLAVLNEWAGRGLETSPARAGERSGAEPDESAAIETSFGIPVADVQYRITQLERSAPEQVCVQVSVPAGLMERLAEVDQASLSTQESAHARRLAAAPPAREPATKMRAKQRRGMTAGGRGAAARDKESEKGGREERSAGVAAPAERAERSAPEHYQWASVKEPGDGATSRPARLGQETLRLLGLVTHGVPDGMPGAGAAPATQSVERVAFSVILVPPARPDPPAPIPSTTQPTTTQPASPGG